MSAEKIKKNMDERIKELKEEVIVDVGKVYKDEISKLKSNPAEVIIIRTSLIPP